MSPARRTTSSRRFAGCRDLDLEGLGQKLLVVRELPVDPSAREPDVAGREDDVVLVHAELDVLAPAARRASSWSARAGMIASRSGPPAESAVSFTARRYESVAAMIELVAFEPYEDPGEDRP